MDNVSAIEIAAFTEWMKGRMRRGAKAGRHSMGQQSARVNAFYAKPAGSKLRRRIAAKTLGINA